MVFPEQKPENSFKEVEAEKMTPKGDISVQSGGEFGGLQWNYKLLPGGHV